MRMLEPEVRSRYLLLKACWLLFFALPVLADVSLQVSSSRPSIFFGESFNLTIEVNGADQGLGTPEFLALPPSEIQLLGQHSNSRSSILIINGRVTRESFEGRVFAYQIKPQAAGHFQTGQIRLIVAGKTHMHPGVAVQVSGIEQQDAVVAVVKSSSTSVLVEEPFIITLSVAIAELPEPYAERCEPLHPNLVPQISAGFLEMQQQTPGLKGPDLNQILSKLIDQSGQQPSFAINQYQSQQMGNFGNLFGGNPFQARPIRFRLASQRVTLNNKKYRDYNLALEFTATKEGDVTFGPLSFKGTVLKGVTPNQQAVTREVYTIGPAVTVRVVPPPDLGRPDWFIGSVGKSLKAIATFDTTVCKVGDPLTLTLELTGSISTANLRQPILNLQTELAKDFRIYDDNVKADTLADGKRFKYRVRPTRAGTLEFPAIKLAYYNTVVRGYQTVATLPIPVQARATTQIATADETSDQARVGFLGSRIRALPSGIMLDVQGIRYDSLLPPKHITFSLLALGPALCLLTALMLPLVAFLKALRIRQRRSGALRRVLYALRQAPTPELASHAIHSYLADRLEVPGQALTPSEAEKLLYQRMVPQESASACRALLAKFDEAMYRPDADMSLAEIVSSCPILLATIDAALERSTQNKKITDGNLLPLLFIVFWGALSGQANDAVHTFIWEQANAQAASATAPPAFLHAANSYNRLVAEGIHNGYLFLNLGNTLVMAGDGVNAVAAIVRAERYLGATPEMRQGLTAAYALRAGRTYAELPWSRTAFFWHYAFPCSLRVIIALVGWTLFWFGLFVRLLARHRAKQLFFRSLADTCLLTGCLVALVFGASSAMTILQERHDTATWNTRVYATSAEQEDTP